MTIAQANRDPLSPWVSIPRFLYGRLGIKRGVGRAVMTLARAREALHRMPVRMNDGRTLYLDLREPMCMQYLLGGGIWMEAGETEFVRSVVRSGETVVDIGANVGWYSTVLADLVGAEGRVFAFEPSEKALRLLTETARSYPQIHVVPDAVSDRVGEEKLHIPADGVMASLNQLTPRAGAALTTQSCRVTTLDRFLERQGAVEIAFIKCDAEGAELGILSGASGLLANPRPPVWMIEMNIATAEQFGYHPDAIVRFFQQLPDARYAAYQIDLRSGRLEPLRLPITLERFNAAFVPEWGQDRVATLLRP